jgi:hypothetical protein
LIAALNAGAWLSGLRPTQLAEAVERGAARIETRTRGELSDDTIRKAIRTQRDSLPFWRTLALLGDFGIEPLMPAVRALIVSVLLAALAALTGRPPGFGAALAENAKLQGLWVAGLAAPLFLMVVLRRDDIETSAALALGAGAYPASAWVALRQVEPFALVGWLATIRGAWGRHQANLVVAAIACFFLAILEMIVRIMFILVMGSGMRLMMVPE